MIKMVFQMFLVLSDIWWTGFTRGEKAAEKLHKRILRYYGRAER